MARWLTLSVLLLVPSMSHAQESPTLNPFGVKVGSFALIEAKGAKIGSSDLLGRIWVAHFFYPGCNGPCSKTVPAMRELQKAVAGKDEVKLVSIALNGDTPDTLKAFAKDQGADRSQWWFLTGPDSEVHDVVQRCFFQTAMRKKNPQPGDLIDHTPTLILVDADGAMVGYLDGQQPGVVDILAKQIQRLRMKLKLDQPLPLIGVRSGVLPAWNASLNALCTVLLVVGYLAIRARKETLHKALMLTALAVSAVFLASYLYYHFAVLGAESMRFQGEGPVRVVYFTILLTHTVLAVAVAPLALYISWQGLKDNRLRHVKLARITLPIWLYVSVTGVVVYTMLYVLYPPI